MPSLPAVGLRIPQYGSSWPEIRDAALRIERLGFDSLWVNDHLQSPGRVKRDPTFDGFTTLAALAPYRRPPFRWTRTEPGLEDVFIHLMGRVVDNFR